MDDDVRPVNPATLDLLGRVPSTTTEEIDDAASRAAAALDGWSGDAWRRASVLGDWAEALTERADEFANALVVETGKTVTEAHREVHAAVSALAYNAKIAHRLARRAGSSADSAVAHIIRGPVGVTTFIAPWHWPVLLLLRDLAPALAAGVTALVKPDPQTTLITGRLLALGHAAGLPADVGQLLVGSTGVGRAAITHPAVRAVTFTGSSPAGAQILRAAGRGLKRPLLELGAKGTIIICEDADLDGAVAAAVTGTVLTAGQTCMACRRVLVDRRHYRHVLERLTDSVKELTVGDPADERSGVGPVISPAAGERLAAYLSSAAMASTVVTGGRRIHPDGLAGYFLSPAVVTDVQLNSPLVQHELLGPIVTVEPFDDEADAVRLANAGLFGLTTGIWTRDLGRAWRLARAVSAGSVRINGFSHSYRRARGTAGIQRFTELRPANTEVAAPV